MRYYWYASAYHAEQFHQSLNIASCCITPGTSTVSWNYLRRTWALRCVVCVPTLDATCFMRAWWFPKTSTWRKPRNRSKNSLKRLVANSQLNTAMAQNMKHLSAHKKGGKRWTRPIPWTPELVRVPVWKATHNISECHSPAGNCRVWLQTSVFRGIFCCITHYHTRFPGTHVHGWHYFLHVAGQSRCTKSFNSVSRIKTSNAFAAGLSMLPCGDDMPVGFQRSKRHPAAQQLPQMPTTHIPRNCFWSWRHVTQVQHTHAHYINHCNVLGVNKYEMVIQYELLELSWAIFALPNAIQLKASQKTALGTPSVLPWHALPELWPCWCLGEWGIGQVSGYRPTAPKGPKLSETI